MIPLSTITTDQFFTQFKNNIPRYIRLLAETTDDIIKSWIITALERYNNFIITNDLGLYNVTADFDFYLNDAVPMNIRDDVTVETRWWKISPAGFFARKLLSCRLKSMNPNDIVLPPGVAYVQDVPILIDTSKSVNDTVPGSNSGLCSLEESSSFFNSLSLDKTNNTFDNVAQIDCLITYYRPIILPTFPAVDAPNNPEYLDVPASDIELLILYGLDIAYEDITPSKLLQAIADREANMLLK